jgi:hypothetical protein
MRIAAHTLVSLLILLAAQGRPTMAASPTSASPNVEQHNPCGLPGEWSEILRQEPVLLVSPTAYAEDKPDAFTEEKAMKLATEYVQKRKLNWGDPEKTEKKDADTFWVFFKTPEKEEKILWKRTLVVKRDGTVSPLPRR